MHKCREGIGGVLVLVPEVSQEFCRGEELFGLA